jgi:hypothetical protein
MIDKRSKKMEKIKDQEELTQEWEIKYYNDNLHFRKTNNNNNDDDFVI